MSMSDSWTGFVSYLKSLGFTSDQLWFLAGTVAAILLCGYLLHLLASRFKQRKLRQEITRQQSEVNKINSLLVRVGNIEGLIGAVNVGELIREEGRSLIANLPEEVRLRIRQRLASLLESAVTKMSNDENQIQHTAQTVFRELLQGVANEFPANAPATLKERCTEAMTGFFDTWLDDETDDDVKDAAQTAFQTLLARVGTDPSPETLAKLKEGCESAMKAMIDGWLEDDDDEDVKEAASVLLKRLLADQESAPITPELRTAVASALKGEVDSILENENDDVTESANALLKRTLDEQAAAPVSTELGTAVEKAVAAQCQELVDSDDDFAETLREHARKKVESLLASK